jgi:predicted nucleic acid-binding Zn finger protein
MWIERPYLHDAFYIYSQRANKSMSRIDDALASGSVKQMFFLPSGKRLWIVVGKDNEYWTDPDLGFCSCKDFYFTTLSGGDECYHLKSVRKAIEENRFTTVEFSDSEYVEYLQAIAEDNANLLGRS